ncbi:MAG TPA: type II toxin-antitoxin system prevent-host-death family antitoxin [Methylosinus sp.]|jgi:antitoxin (DNA-binding transcriptional repressor) of toxin-antitoxin stability system
MRTVDIQEATTSLSRLVDLAAEGESFIIAKAGKPLVKVTALSIQPDAKLRRLGFMKGDIRTPDDFDRMGAEDIERLFGRGA